MMVTKYLKALNSFSNCSFVLKTFKEISSQSVLYAKNTQCMFSTIAIKKSSRIKTNSSEFSDEDQAKILQVLNNDSEDSFQRYISLIGMIPAFIPFVHINIGDDGCKN